MLLLFVVVVFVVVVFVVVVVVVVVHKAKVVVATFRTIYQYLSSSFERANRYPHARAKSPQNAPREKCRTSKNQTNTHQRTVVRLPTPPQRFVNYCIVLRELVSYYYFVFALHTLFVLAVASCSGGWGGGGLCFVRVCVRVGGGARVSA